MATRDKDEHRLFLELLDAFHEHGLYMPTRTVVLTSEKADMEGETGVDSKMVERFLKNLHLLEHTSHEEITVLLNNVGGDVYHGLAIYDAVKESPCPVRMIVRGHAMSMGSVILQAAAKRVMGPTATQMIHYGSAGASCHSQTFLKLAKEEQRINEWMEDLYLRRIREKRKMSIEELRKLLDHDTFLTAQQSIDLGLADGIG